MSLVDKVQYELKAKEPWPKDVRLFQPYEVEQILLPDNANCLAVQTFLKMCNLDYVIDPRPNADSMSPTGKVPFIKCGAFIVSELEGIVQCVQNKGISLSEELSTENKSDLRAYMSLINNVLGNAELYICWCDNETYTQVTKPRYGSIYPWPLNHIQAWTKRSEEIKRLKVMGWGRKSLEEVYNDVESCCQALTDRLNDSTYFYGDKFTELDALLYAHVYLMLTVPLPVHLGLIVTKYERLIRHCRRIDSDVMGRTTDLTPRLFNSQRFISNPLILNDDEDSTVDDESRKHYTNSNVIINVPTELDALLFGHLFTILTTPLPDANLANIVKNFPKLIDLTTRVEKHYFQKETQH